MDKPINLTLSKIQQLVSLNNMFVNFESQFEIKSKADKPFYMLVVSQSELDSLPEGDALDFKHVSQGKMSASIKQDNNLAENWYIVLKSDEPNEVEVRIQARELPMAADARAPFDVAAPRAKRSINWSFIIAVVIIALIAAYLIYKYVIVRPGPGEPVVAIPIPPSEPVPFSNNTDDLLSRINSLPDL